LIKFFFFLVQSNYTATGNQNVTITIKNYFLKTKKILPVGFSPKFMALTNNFFTFSFLSKKDQLINTNKQVLNKLSNISILPNLFSKPTLKDFFLNN
jgi:hypothetical protein